MVGSFIMKTRAPGNSGQVMVPSSAGGASCDGLLKGLEARKKELDVR